MPIRDKLSRKTANLKRKLMDYKIRMSGNCSQVIRLYTEENKYGDETITVLCHNPIITIINYPGELPLYRLRNDNGQIQISEPTGVFFYDIIPIEVFTQWKDDVEKGDLLIRKIKDDKSECLINILRISEVLGSFKTDLVWKKCQAAPHNMTLTSEVIDIINNY